MKGKEACTTGEALFVLTIPEKHCRLNEISPLARIGSLGNRKTQNIDAENVPQYTYNKDCVYISYFR